VYDLLAKLEGFAEVKKQVTLQVNTPATIDVKMDLAGLAEAVTVQAEVVMLNTTDASVGNAFDERQVRNLPLLTRNVVEHRPSQDCFATSHTREAASRSKSGRSLFRHSRASWHRCLHRSPSGPSSSKAASG
jgi:hypothetical protein